MAAKASDNESVNGRMTACDDKSGRQKTMQQPTNDGSSKAGVGGGSDGDSDGSGGGGGGR